MKFSNLNPVKLAIRYVCWWDDWIKSQNSDFDKYDNPQVVIIGLFLGLLGFIGLLSGRLMYLEPVVSWFVVFVVPVAFLVAWHGMIVIIVYTSALIKNRKEWMDE